MGSSLQRQGNASITDEDLGPSADDHVVDEQGQGTDESDRVAMATLG